MVVVSESLCVTNEKEILLVHTLVLLILPFN